MLLDELGRYRPELLDRPAARGRLAGRRRADGGAEPAEVPELDLRISSVTGQGLPELVGRLAVEVDAAPGAPSRCAETFVVHRPVAEGIRIERADDGSFRVVGRQAERAVALSDLTNPEALDYAQPPPAQARGRPGPGPGRRVRGRPRAHRRAHLHLRARRDLMPWPDSRWWWPRSARRRSPTTTATSCAPAIAKLCAEVAAAARRRPPGRGGHLGRHRRPGLPALGLGGDAPAPRPRHPAGRLGGGAEPADAGLRRRAGRPRAGGRPGAARPARLRRPPPVPARPGHPRPACSSSGVVPVVNENDAIADDEIRFGDNDRIAALVAHLVGADTARAADRHRPACSPPIPGSTRARR